MRISLEESPEETYVFIFDIDININIEYTNETEARIFKNVQKGLASRLQDLSMSYRKKQKQFFQKLRSVNVRVCLVIT